MPSVEIKDGQITINMYEIFENMNDKEKTELANAYSIHDPMFKSIVESLRSNYAAPNYNQYIHDLRKAFLLMEVDKLGFDNYDIINRMKQTISAILVENIELKVRNNRLSNLRPNLYAELKRTLGDDIAYKVHSTLIQCEMYGVEDTYAHVEAKNAVEEVIKPVTLDKALREWKDQMIQYIKDIEGNNESEQQ